MERVWKWAAETYVTVRPHFITKKNLQNSSVAIYKNRLVKDFYKNQFDSFSTIWEICRNSKNVQ